MEPRTSASSLRHQCSDERRYRAGCVLTKQVLDCVPTPLNTECYAEWPREVNMRNQVLGAVERRSNKEHIGQVTYLPLPAIAHGNTFSLIPEPHIFQKAFHSLPPHGKRVM